VDLDHLDVSSSHGVMEIKLNRPELRNVISAGPGGTRAQIVHALDEAEKDPAIGAVILSAAGSIFCAGGDLTGGIRRENAYEDRLFLEEADAFHRRIREAKIPTIAAVQGGCLGAGLSLAASCDLIIGTEDAVFGLPEGRLGLVGATYLVPIVGRQWAKFLLLTGEAISASRAQEIGLILTTVPDDRLKHRVRDLALRISRMPRMNTLMNKRAVDAVADLSGDAAGRAVGVAADNATLTMAGLAEAPDGRKFRDILNEEGLLGLKPARRAQWSEPWLSTRPTDPT
jgi:enoyl-CoA hydratase/carnithine racemase